MLQSFPISPQSSFLAAYRLPPLTFSHTTSLSGALREAWKHLHGGRVQLAMHMGRELFQAREKKSTNQQAALHILLAAGYWDQGDAESTRRLALHALELLPQQWSAYRILLDVHTVQQEFEDAYALIQGFTPPRKSPGWDEALPAPEMKTFEASLAWRTKDWDAVSDHLLKAYPKGVRDMPRPLLEDWFRLALYRHQAEDAASAAALLVNEAERSMEFTDALLQTLVQQGWTEYALPLYRSAYAAAPRNQLLRRRLVALCIREGAIEEARALAKPGALDAS